MYDKKIELIYTPEQAAAREAYQKDVSDRLNAYKNSPEYFEEKAAEAEELRVEKARQQVVLDRLEGATALLQPIITMHCPEDFGYCCECSEQEWPCRTIELILEGINK